ncbi:uncharacterized protein At5g01610-like [Vitis riparia]|uniref:uncharacterized protein At5g01610-like n=1 Tax=Vitis riparia TaxID=96939 RepID=UPI00155A4999|nr:uncharacterized protein At5g01610-like [Vitis riparia]
MDSATTQRSLISLVATLCLILIHSTPANSYNNSPNAYEVLREYNFPMGLLPKGMKGYDLNSSTGEFSAYFNETCSFSVQGSYELKFSSTVTGYISKDTLSGLDGISVKFFLLTLNIVGIIRNGDNLVISAGFESAPFPIDNFEESPQCGCGFQCSLSE